MKPAANPAPNPALGPAPSPASTLVRELENYAVEELELQRRLLTALREQEAALFHGDMAAIREGVQRFDAALRGAPQRAARRGELLRRMAQQFRVSPKSLTLTSICARLGPDGVGLARQATELREATQAVSAATRRLGALARLHVRLNGELLAAVLGGEGAGAMPAGALPAQGRGAAANQAAFRSDHPPLHGLLLDAQA
ncbi:MAG: flagellar export chaperone FlgN [Planctomycetes bacterium]|nr:flagellar export chaperone FlgN [Planctomycetota bacterium]